MGLYLHPHTWFNKLKRDDVTFLDVFNNCRWCGALQISKYLHLKEIENSEQFMKGSDADLPFTTRAVPVIT